MPYPSGGRPGRKLDAVELPIAELKATRTRMHRTLRHWDETLANTPANRPAHLLESLPRWSRALYHCWPPGFRQRLKRAAGPSAATTARTSY